MVKFLTSAVVAVALVGASANGAVPTGNLVANGSAEEGAARRGLTRREQGSRVLRGHVVVQVLAVRQRHDAPSGADFVDHQADVPVERDRLVQPRGHGIEVHQRGYLFLIVAAGDPAPFTSPLPRHWATSWVVPVTR